MADDDKNTVTEVTETYDEGKVAEDLLAGLSEIADGLEQNAADDEAGFDDDTDDGETAGGENDSDEDSDDSEDDDSDDGDAEDGEDKTDDDDDAGKGEPAKEQVAVQTDRKTKRLLSELEQYAKSNGYGSVEEMIADAEGSDAETVKKRIESNELTDREKAELYDKEHGLDPASKAQTKEEAGKRVHDQLLSEIVKEYPELKDSIKNLNTDIDDPEIFRDLIVNHKKSAVEAFKMTNYGKIPKRVTPSGKSHLVPNAKNNRGGSTISISAEELREGRELFPDMSDKEIAKLYQKVKN